MFTEKQSIEVLKKSNIDIPSLLIILGTGWNSLLDEVEVRAEIPYSVLFGVDASVPGHEGKLVIGEVEGKQVALMVGRFHMYEGYSARDVTLPIRVLAESGIKDVIITAAVGALNPKFEVGDFVVLNDLLTLFMALDNPLIGPKFLDMSQVFDENMMEKIKLILSEQKAQYQEGVYAYYHGPSFETATDKMALKSLGGDVVGMSTIPETIQAKWLGLKVLGLAFVTNLAFVKHDHHDVMAAAQNASSLMATILREYILLSEKP